MTYQSTQDVSLSFHRMFFLKFSDFGLGELDSLMTTGGPKIEGTMRTLWNDSNGPR